MSERDEQTGHLPAAEPQGATRVPPADDWREQTIPGMTPVRGGAAADPRVGAGPGWNATGPAQQGYAPQGYEQQGYGPDGYGPGTTAPSWSDQPVPVRRPAALAGLLLVLAGVAAAVSLRLHWLRGDGDTGWAILRSALRTAGRDLGTFLSAGWWEPAVVVLGGGLLLLLGLLLLVPARTHRFLGLLALLVALAVTAGVLAPMAQDGWSTGRYELGWWVASAVAALGLLGALRAVFGRAKRRSAVAG